MRSLRLCYKSRMDCFNPVFKFFFGICTRPSEGAECITLNRFDNCRPKARCRNRLGFRQGSKCPHRDRLEICRSDRANGRAVSIPNERPGSQYVCKECEQTCEYFYFFVIVEWRL